MTKDEALAFDLALEALKKARSRIVEAGGSGWKLEAQQCVNAITAIKQALAAPVPKGMVLLPKRMTKAMSYVTEQEDWTWEDLLAAAEAITEDEYNEIATQPAQPAPVQERCEYCDGTGDVHDQTGEWRGTCHCVKAAQRQWVGLTDEDFGLENSATFRAGAVWADAKLKEKNT